MGCICGLHCPLSSVSEQNLFFSSTIKTALVTSLVKTKSWMRRLDDNALISSLSIPGTHDSASYACTFTKFRAISQCQAMTFLEQLEAGIRYLDIRIQTIEGEIIMVHGSIKFENVEEAIKQVAIFLKNNPSECVMMSFQNRDSPGNRAAIAILDLMKKYKVEYLLSKEIPTVGQLRGKVWLLKGFDTEFDPPTYEVIGHYGEVDTEELYLQNFYINNQDTSLDQKWQYCKKVAFQVPSIKEGSHRPRMRINFLSIAGPEHWTAVFKGPYPSHLAMHHDGPNAKMNQELQCRGKVSTGVLVMDFPGHRLVQNIINSNTFVQESSNLFQDSSNFEQKL